MVPLANWYADAAGYRKLGLRYEYIPVFENRYMGLGDAINGMITSLVVA